jgi:glycosyltransferase involved in cell wall biosynthesis
LTGDGSREQIRSAQSRLLMVEVASSPPSDASSRFEPLVSVVIPAYDRAHLIGRAVSSALAQTYRNFEIVVVDDASSDGLAAALGQFSDPRLRCITHSHNRGAAAARNTGVTSARGEFVAFLDSDDVWVADKLAVQVAAMRGLPAKIAGHVCAYECVKPGSRTRLIVPEWTAATFRRSQLFGCTCGPGTTLLCRRSVFADVGPFDEELRRLEDWDWLLRLSAKGYRLLGSPAVLAWVEVGSGAKRREVDAAVRRIRARHHAAVAREGAASRRIFEAGLHFESAAAAFGDKAFAHAASGLMRSLACYPRRGGAFYWRRAQRAAALAGLGRAP